MARVKSARLTVPLCRTIRASGHLETSKVHVCHTLPRKLLLGVLVHTSGSIQWFAVGNEQYNGVTNLHTVCLAVFNLSTRTLTTHPPPTSLTNLLLFQHSGLFKVRISTNIKQYHGQKHWSTGKVHWPAAVPQPFRLST